MRKSILIIGMILGIILVILCDYFSTDYGRGWGIFHANLPKGINLKYDRYEGVKFVENNIIHIVSTNVKFEGDSIKQILGYWSHDNVVCVKVISSKSEIICLGIYVSPIDETNINYKIKKEECINEKWIDVSDNNDLIKYLLVARILSLLFTFIVLIFLIGILVKEKNTVSTSP